MSDEHRIEFTGSGREYFSLWIVNLLLTIVTLGIYSPWAKVRRLQYFYRSTRVAESVFDYHGSPLALLKGRIMALALLGAYYAVGYLSFALALVILVALAAALPWLIHRSFRFKLYQSSYRGIRFRFNGSLQGAYRVVLIPLVMVALPLGMFGSLGGRLTGGGQSGTLAGVVSGVFALMSIAGLVLLPWFHHALKQYQHGHSALGTTASAFSARPGAFYGIYLRGWAVTIMVGISFAVLVGIGLAAIGASSMWGGAGGSDFHALLALLPVLAVLAFYASLLIVLAFVNARLQNTVWNATSIGALSFRSEVRAGALARIYVKNLLLLACTLGLYTPFAVINTLRYRLDSMTLIAPGGIDALMADARPGENDTTGEGAVDLFDIDIAL